MQTGLEAKATGSVGTVRLQDLRDLCAHKSVSLRWCRVWDTCALQSGSGERGCEREQLTAPGLPPHSRPMFSKRPHDFCNLCAHKSDSLRCCRVWNTCALQIVLG